MSGEPESHETVVFDFDGVLIEPTDDTIFLQADKKAFTTLVGSHSSDLARIQAEHGTGNERATVVREVFEDSYDVNPDEYWEQRESQAFQYQKILMCHNTKELYPEVSKVLSEIPRSVKTGIVSNNQDRTIRWAIKFFGWDEYFDVYRGRDPTTKGLCLQKPDSYYLKEVTEELQVRTGLYIGDKETDLIAARAAGLNSALLQRPENDISLECVRPDYEISNLTEILELL